MKVKRSVKGYVSPSERRRESNAGGSDETDGHSRKIPEIEKGWTHFGALIGADGGAGPRRVRRGVRSRGRVIMVVISMVVISIFIRERRGGEGEGEGRDEREDEV